jgi:hypothetical protein
VSVIINDFEIVADAPAERPKGGDPSPAPAPSGTPQDVRDVIQRLAERMARLRAH